MVFVPTVKQIHMCWPPVAQSCKWKLAAFSQLGTWYPAEVRRGGRPMDMRVREVGATLWHGWVVPGW